MLEVDETFTVIWLSRSSSQGQGQEMTSVPFQDYFYVTIVSDVWLADVAALHAIFNTVAVLVTLYVVPLLFVVPFQFVDANMSLVH